MSHLHSCVSIIQALLSNSGQTLRVIMPIIAVLLTSSPGLAATPFVHEYVDTLGTDTDLALDGRGNPHVSYFDAINLDLKYATKLGDSWVVETVDATGFVGTSTSIAVDSNGNPHIGYYDATNQSLKYAFKSRDIWVIETVDAVGNAGQEASLALDRRGNPHISYYEATNGDLKYAYRSGGGWTIEDVDTAGSVGAHTSIAIDHQGQPHISYYDLLNTDLKYAVRLNDVTPSWSVEVVMAANPDLIGVGTSLALDAQDNPHIAFQYQSPAFDLYYAKKSKLLWAIEVVDSGADVGATPSLALDSDGDPHISYYDLTFQDLKYAKREGGGAWQTETVDWLGITGANTSIALDAQGNPHVSYSGNDHLKFASSSVRLSSPLGGETWTRGGLASVTWEGAGVVDVFASQDGGAGYSLLLTGATGGHAQVSVPSWATEDARIKIVRTAPLSSSESNGVFSIVSKRVSPWWHTTVESNGNVGSFVSLELSSTGNPSASYHDNTNGDLRYTSRMESGWAVDTVDTTGDVGSYSSLEIDVQGEPHISYYDDTNDDLKYAVRSGTNWSIETVDAAGNVGMHSFLQLGADGTPHICYYDLSNVDLKYAVRTGGWFVETVDAAGFVGSYASLAIGPHGAPHISYHDQTNTSLKYATKIGGSWNVETVDAGGDVGSHTSIAVDAKGTIHVSYYDNAQADLKYAAKTNGVWSAETVDAVGSVGLYTSIAVRADGSPAITYYDSGNGDLKFATRDGGRWVIETIQALDDVGQHTSLALDSRGNPHVCYFNFTNTDLEYASGAVAVSNPSSGAVWPVGATRAVTWNGDGAVDIGLSVDGGSTYTLLATEVSGGRFDLRVPHTPSKFSMLRIERREDANDFGSYVYRHSISATGQFTIETSIELLALLASATPGEMGLLVSWNTDPGPADLAGYRLEKISPGNSAVTLMSRTKETSHHDVQGRPGDRYRLFAINGLNEEFYLGETGPADAAIPGGLAVYPLPLRSGDLNIEFATTTLGTEVLDAKVSIHDIQGRVIRRVPVGGTDGPFHRVTWDGRDGRGMPVASGVYFIRVTSGPMSRVRRLVVAR